MDKFKNLKLEDDVVTGKYNYYDGEVDVEFDLEEDDTEMDDFSELISDANNWIENLTQENLNELKTKIAKELTDSAYSDSDYKPTEKDYKDLENELTLTDVRFFPDQVISLVFKAKKEYPDMDIYCQIDNEFQVEDLFVE
ncbi:hypothetical protein SAMN05421841_3654 [Chryseobacterium wanjuense]|uniref:DUF2262 domain-containing protein n=1 Tax=Chryseobacterium wanjuense TaxID=356305 RepID=A0A1I0S0N8_9FLAO|nr:hypothetical protein [Chryseobacterium wanjuense]SEW47891.1 hypothetical protein SAMN05421841_3654 [Chryseobacterium wanjuense]